MTVGFRQANSRQESRKSAKRRDNDTEIRDRLTPPPAAVCSLATTSTSTHTHTRTPSEKKNLPVSRKLFFGRFVFTQHLNVLDTLFSRSASQCHSRLKQHLGMGSCRFMRSGLQQSNQSDGHIPPAEPQASPWAAIIHWLGASGREEDTTWKEKRNFHL